MVWCLFYLLRRFLLRGPDFLSSVKHNKKIMVGELSIDVLTHHQWTNAAILFYRDSVRGS